MGRTVAVRFSAVELVERGMLGFGRNEKITVAMD
jgi:hypothetical protein